MNNYETSTATGTANNVHICPVCGNYLVVDKNTYEKRCRVCNYSEVTLPHTIVNESDLTLNVTPPKEENVSGLYGWICPKCGAVMSPFTSCCPNCTPTKSITCTY